MTEKKEGAILAFLSHHGVKGQRWGVRRTKAALARASRREGRTPPSEEHARSRELLKKGRKNLSNPELEELNKRLNLEQNFKRLNQSTVAKGKTKTLATIATISTVAGFLNTPPGKAAVALGKVAVGNILAKSSIPVTKGLPIKVK